ncbi:MAG: hypothetical protein AAFQ58_23650 [Pseudomonadota bacterium]
MKGGYQSFENVWNYLAEIGVLGPAGKALLAMLLAGGAILVGMSLYSRYKRFRVLGGREGVRTRKRIETLRAQGQLAGEFTFADAVELTQTGTIRPKSLADKMVNCVVPIEILFSSTEHGIVYQFEMEQTSNKVVATWVEVAQTLNLADVSKILEEISLMRDVICHTEFDPEYMSGDETIYDKLNRRALELHDEFARIDGIARLRSACETYLRKNAPHKLPLPTW